MNVCIKASELQLAEDVYQQMIEQGCTPTLVTYNILIDVHVKRGHWEEALAVLDQLERQVSHQLGLRTRFCIAQLMKVSVMFVPAGEGVAVIKLSN